MPTRSRTSWIVQRWTWKVRDNPRMLPPAWKAVTISCCRLLERRLLRAEGVEDRLSGRRAVAGTVRQWFESCPLRTTRIGTFELRALPSVWLGEVVSVCENDG